MNKVSFEMDVLEENDVNKETCDGSVGQSTQGADR